VVLCFAVALLAGSGHSQDQGFGIGVILGEPTGISGKIWTSQQNAVDAGLAYSFRRKGYFHLHADYLWHFPHVIQSAERFPLFAGIGGRVAAGRGSGIFGIRIPFGLAYWVRSAPVEVFLEVAPIVDLAPATEVSGNGGIGARFFFR
jgi:hypothetical protein